MSTPEKVRIQPTKSALRVRKPNGQLLDPTGESVTWSAYWRRREQDGDVERQQIAAKTKASSKASGGKSGANPPPAE